MQATIICSRDWESSHRTTKVSIVRNANNKRLSYNLTVPCERFIKKFIDIYCIFSEFVEMTTFLACNASIKLPILNQCRVRMRRLLYYSQPFSMFLTRDAKIVSHWLIGLSVFVINIWILKYFFSKIGFQNFFSIIFLSKLSKIFFFQIFFSNFFLKTPKLKKKKKISNFFPKFFYQNYFS